MTKKASLIKTYRELSAATEYIIGFTYESKLYMTTVKNIMPRFLTTEKESAKNGGSIALRLRLKKEHKTQLIKKSVCLGDESLLTNSKYNKGETFEKIVTENMGLEWKKDNVPFYKAGDISINGKEIQVKLENATIASERSLKNAKEILKAEA